MGLLVDLTGKGSSSVCVEIQYQTIEEVLTMNQVGHESLTTYVGCAFGLG